jgi:hypothetical protein
MRRHFSIVFVQGLAIALVVGLMIGFSPVVFISGQAFAQLITGDDFNDNIMDPVKWGADDVKGYGKLEEINGRLEYTTDGSWGATDSSDRPWKQLLPTDMSWSIEITATNHVPTMGSRWASFGINIESTRDPDDEIEVSLASANQSHMFWSELRDNGVKVYEAGRTTSLQSAPILIVYNHMTQVFTVAYKEDSTWVSFGSHCVNGYLCTTNWGFISTDQFTVTVFGYSENTYVGPQTLFGDDFRVVMLPPPSILQPTVSMGSDVIIDGSGFGTSRGTVVIGDAVWPLSTLADTASAATVKPVKAKITNWSDDRISFIFNKAIPAGTYDVTINPKVKPPSPIIMTDVLTVTNPVIISIPDGGAPEQEITMLGSFFGTKKGKVYLEYMEGTVTKKKNCKVTEWSMYDLANGSSRIKFMVPKLSKTFISRDYTLKVVNKIGYAERPFFVGMISDRKLKENIAPIDGKEVLTRLAGIPVSSWNYTSQGPSIRHIGPMAQDFQSAFNVGESDRFINMVDSGGVALASIQGLYSILQEKEREIRSLKNENLELKEEIRDIGKRLAAIENQTPK